MTNAVADTTPFAKAIETGYRNRSATSAMQSAAYDRYRRLGLPNRRVEGWKWSDFNAALRGPAPANDAAPVETIPPSPFATLEPLEIQIVDGRVLAPDAARLEGFEFGVIDPGASDPDFDSHSIVALNIALTRRAFGFRVASGANIERPILIRHINKRGAHAFSQVLGRAEEGSRATIIETFEGQATFHSAMHHLSVYKDAELSRYVLHDADARTVTHGFFGAMVGEGARFRQASLSTGGRLCRHETHLLCPAATGFSDVASAALVGGERHSDFTTQVRFRAPGGEARQLHKGVANGKGRNIFQGKFHVERAAQKTDAKMTANALLLSDGAEANHKPELEIYADDVECAHGSTVGALDDDALFYLRQRGLSEHAARALLIDAFAGEVIDRIDDDRVRGIFASRVAAWLEEQR